MFSCVLRPSVGRQPKWRFFEEDVVKWANSTFAFGFFGGQEWVTGGQIIIQIPLYFGR
jgi:hypothetical protein